MPKRRREGIQTQPKPSRSNDSSEVEPSQATGSSRDEASKRKRQKTADRVNQANKSFYASLFSPGAGGTKPHYTDAGLHQCADLKLARDKDMLPRDKRARILEFGPGDGRVLKFLLANGYNDITAIERDAAAVGKLRKKFAGRVTIIKGDFTQYRSKTTYDCILWLWCGFSDFSSEGQQAMLHQAMSLLTPGKGKLLLDIARPKSDANVTSIGGDKVYKGGTYSHTRVIGNSIYRAYMPDSREVRHWLLAMKRGGLVNNSRSVDYAPIGSRRRALFEIYRGTTPVVTAVADDADDADEAVFSLALTKHN